MKALLLLLAIISLAEGNAAAQEKTAPPPDPAAANAEATLAQNSQDVSQEPPQTLENTIEAEQSSEPPRRRLVRWNEYQGPYFTVRAGAGLLLEVAGFGLMLVTLAVQSTVLLYVALAVVFSGFSFMTPSLNGLLSRRSAPARKGERLSAASRMRSGLLMNGLPPAR